jgi:hypothetical protein
VTDIAVEVVPNRVQALSGNDPAYMSDVCAAPRLLPDGTIHCAAGSFLGPPGAKLAIADGRLRRDWYDGGRLILQRQD